MFYLVVILSIIFKLLAPIIFVLNKAYQLKKTNLLTNKHSGLFGLPFNILVCIEDG